MHPRSKGNHLLCSAAVQLPQFRIGAKLPEKQKGPNNSGPPTSHAEPKSYFLNQFHPRKEIPNLKRSRLRRI